MAQIFVVVAVTAWAFVAIIVSQAKITIVALMRLMAIVILIQCRWPYVNDFF